MWARPHLTGREPCGVPCQILARLLKPVQRRRQQRVNVVQGTAQPCFRQWFRRMYREIADAAPVQFLSPAFLRCRLSGMLSPCVNVPVIADASLLKVPS
jgi:hypothetical protein